MIRAERRRMKRERERKREQKEREDAIHLSLRIRESKRMGRELGIPRKYLAAVGAETREKAKNAASERRKIPFNVLVQKPRGER